MSPRICCRLAVCTVILSSGLGAQPAASGRWNPGDWLAVLGDDPGEVYKDRDNRWLQKVEFSGRLEYQVARVEGRDVNGLEFTDTHDDFRRARLGVEIDFLRHLEANLEVNLVNDDRFRDDPPRELEWGYDRFHEATLEFDLDDAFPTPWCDDLKLTYGRMKLRMGAENHQSSRHIPTIERSSISETLAGDASRPTGATLELEKADWQLVLGLFSGEDDSEFIGGWNDGHFYYGSLGWRPSADLTLLLDYVQNHPRGADDALGYAWAGALSATYDPARWGVTVVAVLGDNGAGPDALQARRQGDFKGFVVMPWYWIVEERLQVVVQYEEASSARAQGLQLRPRYIRGHHDHPLVDVDNGRGDRHRSLYAGVNWHIAPGHLKLMTGVSHERLDTRASNLDATTWQAAVRMAF